MGAMSTSTDTPRGARKARTYLPEAGARDELLDFAELMRQLEVYLAQNSSKAALVDPEGNGRPIPDEIFRILDQVTNALAAGEGITIVPQGMTMTTQQAADFLGISRPTLVRLLEAGDIAFDKPGRHRRVRLEDLVAYQANFRSERRAALRELQRDSLGAKIQVGNPADVKRVAEFDAE
jgi:excisionase family DNA binding protein